MNTDNAIDYTLHAVQRMGERGIKKDMINLAINYGYKPGDKIIIDQECIKEIRKETEYIKGIATDVLSKVGIAVIEKEG